MKRSFITAALPYANGPIHIGHLVEYIQADIISRWRKSTGEGTVFICADDAHGAPIEINAAKQGITPEQLIGKYYQEHQADFSAFHIKFDNYHTTNSPENKAFADKIFTILKSKGHIYQKEVELTYCPQDKRFLPDRYVKGTCPNCGAPDQYGDVCEKCNTAYKTIDLKDPYCSLCKATPIRKKSLHYFFRVSAFSDKLEHWLTHHPAMQDEVRNFALSWIKKGLEDWDISRDGPYFGFKIPGEENMYYYVWLDAPIGYFASLGHWAQRQGIDPMEFLTGEGEMGHFIGKDIMYFHLLFWPAMLMGSGFNLPARYHVHGFLTVNGEKMSKSRGTFLTAREFLSVSDPQLLRFYFASNLGSQVEDIDLNWQDYFDKVNSELVSKVANYCYRVLSFCHQHFEGNLIDAQDEAVEKKVAEELEAIHAGYQAIDLRKAVHHIMELASIGNRYFQEQQPWKSIGTDREGAHRAVSYSIAIARKIAIALHPILPVFTEELGTQLNMDSLRWSALNAKGKLSVNPAKIILTKLEDVPSVGVSEASSPFGKLNIKVGKILSIEDHPNAEKLYVIQLDTGEPRQLVAGLKPYIAKGDLLGKHVLVLCNLKPAKLRGVESQGMMLAADDGTNVSPLQAPHSPPGTQVKAGDIVSIPSAEISIDDFKQAPIKVKGKKALFENHVLKTEQGDIIADAVDGAGVR